MMFFNVPFFVSNQDGLNGCYYTSWIAQWIEIISEIAFLLQPDTVPAKGTSMYYVSTKGGGRGSAKSLHLP